MRPLLVAVLLTLLAPPPAAGVPAAHDAPRWTASWITAADVAPREVAVVHFRRAFDLAAKPGAFRVRVSADNRYELFANGARVAAGPARGELAHWRYETVDLAPHLRAGRNVLAAVVWNFAEHAPFAQVTHSTAFLVQGEDDAAGVVDTGPAWKAARDPSHTLLPVAPADLLNQYYVAGPGERVDGARHPWGWEEPAFDDGAWPAARVVGAAEPYGTPDAKSPWQLVPSAIPPARRESRRRRPNSR